MYLADGDHDQFAALTACALHTEAIRLATGIASVYSRNPAQLAVSVATIDALSHGRFTLGIAVGHSESAGRRDDIELGRPLPYRRGRQRLLETTEIVRAVLEASCAGELAHYEGEIFTLKGFATRVRPYRSNTPIHIGSLAPPAVEFAAGIADGVIASIMPSEAVPEFEAAVERGAAGGSRAVEKVVYVPTFVSDDLKTARLAVEYRLVNYIAMRRNYQRHITRLGYGDVVEAILREAQGGNVAAALGIIPQELLDSTTAYGPAYRCAEALVARRDSGLMPVISGGNPALSPGGQGGSAYEAFRNNLTELAAALS
jgi:alkanesulfonate monooxygenase SsuD/methylene tetrahydromethanopterin reductase-like flavin-dependent oxidoreductase (luciferase family)